MRISLPLRIAWLTVILAVACISAPAQTVFDPASLQEPGALLPEQQSTLLSRRALIIGEASDSPANEWAGKYFSEDSPTSGARA